MERSTHRLNNVKNKILLILFVNLNTFSCLGQIADSLKSNSFTWEELSSFKVYDMQDIPSGKCFTELTDNEMLQLDSWECNLEEAMNALSLSIPSGRYTAIISGMQYATLSFKSGLKKTIKLSLWGFKRLDTGEYYVLNEKGIKKWEEFYAKYIIRL